MSSTRSQGFEGRADGVGGQATVEGLGEVGGGGVAAMRPAWMAAAPVPIWVSDSPFRRSDDGQVRLCANIFQTGQIVEHLRLY